MSGFETFKDRLTNKLHKAALPLLSVIGAASLSSCADVGGYGGANPFAGLNMPPVAGNNSNYGGYGNNQYTNGQNGLDRAVSAQRVSMTQLSRDYRAAIKAGDYDTADAIKYQMDLGRQQYSDTRRKDFYSDQLDRNRDRNIYRAESAPQRIMSAAERQFEYNIRRQVTRGINNAMKGFHF